MRISAIQCKQKRQLLNLRQPFDKVKAGLKGTIITESGVYTAKNQNLMQDKISCLR